MYKKVLLSSIFISSLWATGVEATVANGANKAKNIVKQATSSDKFVPAPTQTITQTSPTPAATKKKLTISEATLKAINSVRMKNQTCAKAANALNWNKPLYEIAKEHSIDMAVNSKLSHTGSGTLTDKTAQRLGLNRGSYFYERVNQKKDSKKYLSGELIIRTDLASLKSPKDLINYWISKPSSCKTIMDPRFTDVALAKVVSNKEQRAYWTLMLMGPSVQKVNSK